MKKELLIAALGIGFSGTLDAVTRKEVERLIDKIAKTPVSPTHEYQGYPPPVTCYLPSISRGREEKAPIKYICIECGTKTLYAFEKENATANYIVSNINNYRNHCETLRKLGWDVKLDESSLCSKCRKYEHSDELFLNVSIDNKTINSQLLSYDLDILVAFAEKKLYWKNISGDHPLNDEISRICTLLGISYVDMLMKWKELEYKGEKKSLIFRIRELTKKPAN